MERSPSHPQGGRAAEPPLRARSGSPRPPPTPRARTGAPSDRPRRGPWPALPAHDPPWPEDTRRAPLSGVLRLSQHVVGSSALPSTLGCRGTGHLRVCRSPSTNHEHVSAGQTFGTWIPVGGRWVPSTISGQARPRDCPTGSAGGPVLRAARSAAFDEPPERGIIQGE